MMKKTAIAGLALAALGTGASADVIMTMGFTDLEGAFDSQSGTFSAVAADNANLSTTGDVTRSGGSTAEFGTGFASGATQADITVSIDVSNITALTADGAGTFTITDADGDVIDGNISGVWVAGGGGIIFFNALLDGVQLTDNGAADGMFNGPTAGAFDMDLPGDGPYPGAWIQLMIRNDGGTFFENDFGGASVQVDGEILPTPGSLAMLALGGLTMVRNGRRRS